MRCPLLDAVGRVNRMKSAETDREGEYGDYATFAIFSPWPKRRAFGWRQTGQRRNRRSPRQINISRENWGSPSSIAARAA